MRKYERVQKILSGGTLLTFLVIDQHISQRAERNSFQKQLGSNCFSRGSAPVFLRKHIATWDFQGGPDPLSPPPPGFSHEQCKHNGLMFLEIVSVVVTRMGNTFAACKLWFWATEVGYISRTNLTTSRKWSLAIP